MVSDKEQETGKIDGEPVSDDSKLINPFHLASYSS